MRAHRESLVRLEPADRAVLRTRKAQVAVTHSSIGQDSKDAEPDFHTRQDPKLGLVELGGAHDRDPQHRTAPQPAAPRVRAAPAPPLPYAPRPSRRVPPAHPGSSRGTRGVGSRCPGAGALLSPPLPPAAPHAPPPRLRTRRRPRRL